MEADLDSDRVEPGRATAGATPEAPGFSVRSTAAGSAGSAALGGQGAWAPSGPAGFAAKAEVIPLGAVPGAEAIRSLLLDLRRRLDAGENLGFRIGDIREAAAAMRASVGGLRRLLEAPDRGLDANPELLTLARKVLALAEWNVAAAEEMLRRLPDRTP